MTRREQLREQYEDALFALLMDEIAQHEGARYLEENERLQQDPDAAVSEERVKRCQAMIRREFSKQNAARFGRASFRVFNRLAVAVCIGVFLFTGAFAASETVRTNTLNFAVSLFGTHAEYRLTEPAAAESNVLSFEVGWLPDGYELIEISETEHFASAYYNGPDGERLYIDLSIMTEDSTVSVDAGNTMVEHITVNGYESTLVTKNGFQLIQPFPDRAEILSVFFNSQTDLAHKEQLLQIVENILLTN